MTINIYQIMLTFISKKGEKVCVEKHILKDCKII